MKEDNLILIENSIPFLGQEMDKVNETFDKVDVKLENNALDLKLNKLSIGSALLNIVTLNTGKSM